MTEDIDVHWPDNADGGVSQPSPPPPPLPTTEEQSFTNPEKLNLSNPKTGDVIQSNILQGHIETTEQEPNVIDVLDENEANNILGKSFYKASSSKVFATGFLLFSIIPFY